MRSGDFQNEFENVEYFFPCAEYHRWWRSCAQIMDRKYAMWMVWHIMHFLITKRWQHRALNRNCAASRSDIVPSSFSERLRKSKRKAVFNGSKRYKKWNTRTLMRNWWNWRASDPRWFANAWGVSTILSFQFSLFVSHRWPTAFVWCRWIIWRRYRSIRTCLKSPMNTTYRTLAKRNRWRRNCTQKSVMLFAPYMGHWLDGRRQFYFAPIWRSSRIRVPTKMVAVRRKRNANNVADQKRIDRFGLFFNTHNVQVASPPPIEAKSR